MSSPLAGEASRNTCPNAYSQVSQDKEGVEGASVLGVGKSGEDIGAFKATARRLGPRAGSTGEGGASQSREGLRPG